MASKDPVLLQESIKQCKDADLSDDEITKATRLLEYIQISEGTIFVKQNVFIMTVFVLLVYAFKSKNNF